MKKHSLIMLIVGALVVGLLYLLDQHGTETPVAQVAKLYTAGKYVGEAPGYGGNIKTEVTLSDNKIENITVLENSETQGIGSNALEALPKDIVKYQSLAIDSFAGASISSKGLKDSVLDALKKAGADIQRLLAPIAKKDAAPASSEQPATDAPKEIVYKDSMADVVVVGGGGAGLTAAITAKEQGANVILLEKMPMLGGNTTYATGGMNAADTELQKKEGVEDTPELFYKDTMKGGKDKNDPALLKVLTEKAKDMVPWLTERGMDLSELTMSGGASVKRMHRPTGGKAVGPILVKALEKKAEDLDVDIRRNSEVKRLLKANGKIVGVEVKDKNGIYRLYSKAIVMATGGFGHNPDMIAEYNPDLKGFSSTNSPAITGEGIKMIKNAGGQLVDMDLIQTHPTVVHGNTAMITESVRGEGAILVNREGKRFISEMETRDVVSKAELAQTGGSAFLIFDQGVREKLKAIDGYVNKGFAKEAQTIEELAGKVGIDAKNLAETIKNANEYAKTKDDKEFQNKALVNELSKAPYYAIEVSPAIHHTMGGVKIDTNAEVLDTNGKPIPGLFAAGEITGGVHGANRIGGNAVADIEVFGKIAGDNAVAYAKGLVSSMDDTAKAKQEQDLRDKLKESKINIVRNGDELNIYLPGGLTFDTGSATIKAGFKVPLDAIAAILTAYPQTIIFITGYTDNVGDADANVKLSVDRAESVKNYLNSKGIDEGRINTAGYGAANPIASNDTEEGKEQNRRVEIKILSSY